MYPVSTVWPQSCNPLTQLLFVNAELSLRDMTQVAENTWIIIVDELVWAGSINKSETLDNRMTLRARQC